MLCGRMLENKLTYVLHKHQQYIFNLLRAKLKVEFSNFAKRTFHTEKKYLLL